MAKGAMRVGALDHQHLMDESARRDQLDFEERELMEMYEDEGDCPDSNDSDGEEED